MLTSILSPSRNLDLLHSRHTVAAICHNRRFLKLEGIQFHVKNEFFHTTPSHLPKP